MESEDTTGHIRIRAELNIYSAGALQKLLLDALNASTQLEIDLSEVCEMDCAGLQLLIATERETARQGKTLRLTGSSREVLDLLELCGLSGILGEAPCAA